MNNELGIEFEIRLHQNETDEIPYSVFRKIIDSLNNSFFESEKRDLNEIQKELPNLPNVAFDAAKHRLKNYRYSAVIIKELRPGSLVIAGCAAGVAIWLLQQTLGETIKEAWLESPGHIKLKQILLKRTMSKKHFLASDAAKRIERAVPSETSISYFVPEEKKALKEPIRIRINVKIKITKKNYPPDRKKLF